jgi:tetratricopeptide (TPR) repeat protein
MRFKPKTVRRLLLLAVVVAIIIGAAFSLFFVRRWQMNRQLASHRREGEAAFVAGNYRKSLAELGRYIQRGRRTDADALLTFARARIALEEPDFGHLRGGIQALHQYLAVRPGDRDQRLVLLRLANQAGAYVDARDAAEHLRPDAIAACGPEHVDVLREEAIALTAARLDGARLDAVVTRLLELEPLDVQGNLIRLEVWGRTDRKDEARRYAEALMSQHPADPVARLVAAASVLVEPGPDDIRVARVRLAGALGVDLADGMIDEGVRYPGPEFVSRAVDILDRIGSFDVALAVLLHWHQRLDHPPIDRVELGLARTLARRLWQQGEHRDCVSILASQPSESMDSEVLAFRALSLQHLRKDAGAIIAILQDRREDFRAAAWAGALPLADPIRVPNPREEAETLKLLVKANNRLEPVLLVMLGECYASLSRVDEARQLWRDAAKSPICASWAFPSVRSAETLLAEGRVEEAGVEATNALQVAYQSPSVNALWFETRAAMAQKGMPADEVRAVLQSLERVVDEIERHAQTTEVRAVWERLLIPRVILLARSGQGGRAAEVVETALDAPDPLAERTLQRLAAASSAERLGVEGRCLERAASISGTTPGVAFARAVEHAQNGEPEQGMALLKDVAAGGGAEARLRLVQYLERIGHEGATKAWIALGDDFPSDLSVQGACLWSSSVASSGDFVERTVGRYQTLTGREAGDEDAAIHTARARVLLHGSPVAKDRDAAIARLALVTAGQAKQIEPRLVLARALLMSDSKRGIKPDEARAEAVLMEAAALDPRSPVITIELAALLARRDQRLRAVDLLSTLARDSTADPLSRQASARQLIGLGGDGVATGVQSLADVAAEVSRAGRQPWPALLVDLGEGYVTVQRHDLAKEVFGQAIAHPRVRAQQVFAAARFFQRSGDSEQLEAALARLAEIESSVAERSLVLAQLADERGDKTEADHRFEEAVSADPSKAEPWRVYISSRFGRSDASGAAQVAARAVRAVPDDPALKVMLERARLTASADGDTADLAPLISALSGDPAMSGATEVLRALEEARQRGELEIPERVGELADRFPTVPLLQAYLAQRVAPLDPDLAVRLISRGRAQSPDDPRIARTAVDVYRTLERWTEALAAAAAWKEHAGRPTPEADLAIAEARLALHDYRGGLAAIGPWVQGAVTDPASPQALAVLRLQGRLLIAADREADARAFLEPLLKDSPSVRTKVWLACAGEDVRDANSAGAWVDHVRQFAAKDETEEQLAVAGALVTLAERFPGEATSILTQAKGVVEGLTVSPATGTAAAWEALGVITHRLGQAATARGHYERALALDGARKACLNNLAMILVDSDSGAALQLATQAVEVSPDADSLQTLGSVQSVVAEAARISTGSKAGFKDALATYMRLAKLRPRDARVWSLVAQAAFDAEEFEQSAAAWQKLAEHPGLTPAATAMAKNNAANALLRQGGAPTLVDQARTLVTQAINAGENPAFQDTLGWVELAAGKREAAVAAFRTALAAGGGESSKIGLAMALAAGSDEERREAAAVAGQVEVKGLDPYLVTKLQRVLSLVHVEKPDAGR